MELNRPEQRRDREALARSLGDSARFVKTDVLSEDSVAAAIAAATELAPLRSTVIVHGGPAAGARIVGRDGKRDLAPLGIRVMCIAPGTFVTPAYRMEEDQAQAMCGPLVPDPKRMGNPDEYARLAAHVVDNDFLNGEVIRIDGAQRFNVK